MPQPTNSEIFDVFDRVTRLEFLPYPAVTYEEHFNTNFLLSLKRFGLLVDKVIGAVKTEGYDVIREGTTLKVSPGILFFKEFVIKEDTEIEIGTFSSNEDRKVILKITEEEYTYESNKDDVEVVVEGRSLSGPNQRRYLVEYLYQSGAVPSDTATEFYLHLADVDGQGTVTKKVPNREELLHELDSGETIITDQNYKEIDTELKNFFTNKKIDFGSGDEIALFADPDLLSINNSALLFRIEKIESLSFNEGVDSSVESVQSIFQNGTGNRCRIKFAWNYKTTVAEGGNGTITVYNSGLESFNTNPFSFSIGSLIGYRIWFDGNWYSITANNDTNIVAGTTVLDIEDSDGNIPDLTGVTASENDPAIIENEAFEYQLRARNRNGESFSVSVLERESSSNSPVKTEAWLELDFGKKYEVKLTTYSMFRFDERTQVLNGGIIEQWGSETLSYSPSPNFIPKFANLPTLPSASLSLDSEDPYSLLFEIDGITPKEEDFAEAYEVVYKVNPPDTGSTGISFESGQYDYKEIIHNYPSSRGTTKSLSLKHHIPPGTERDIEVAYRALVGRQAVTSATTIIEKFGFNKLGSPNNVAVEFLPNGLYEQERLHDVFGTSNFVDRLNNGAAVRVTWDEVDKARGYYIETVGLDSSDNPVDGTRRGTTIPLQVGENDTIGTQGVVVDYTVGRKIKVSVSPLHLDSSRGVSSSVTFQEEVPRLEAPTIGEPEADSLGITVSWTPVDGADHYEVLWSLSRNPQVGSENSPADQESLRTRNAKIRINAAAGSDIYVGILSIDPFGRRSLDISRLQTQSGRIQQEPDLKVWAATEKNSRSVPASENEPIAFSKWTQPVQILGMSVTAFRGEYYEGGTLNSPADSEISDHPVKVRAYRLGEPSNNISVAANSLNTENIIGTQTDSGRDPLLSVAASQTTVLDFINEAATYDLFSFSCHVEVYYKYQNSEGEQTEGVLRTRFNRNTIS